MNWAVVDLGFGDAGKGLVTDALVRRTGARVIIRAQGGAQAGHNVVTAEGRHHCFAQLGATFVDGVRVLLGPEVVVHPGALLAEARALGLDPRARVRIAGEARIITPFHQSAGRIRERRRGEARHGSCGVGVGETVEDGRAFPEDAVQANDLATPELLRSKILRIRARKLDAFGDESGDEGEILRRPEIVDRWIDAVASVAALVTEDLAGWVGDGPVVFEGSQGVMLDEEAGFAPHTTHTCTTFAPAERLASDLGLGVRRLGVLRGHSVRHGAGPFPAFDERIRPRSDHNARNDWQGEVRYGPLDLVLARYALAAAGPVEGLVLTHLDGPVETLVGRWRGEEGVTAESLARAEPVVERTADLVAEVGARLGAHVVGTSRGPTAADLTWALRP